jgi:hypothetical protein
MENESQLMQVDPRNNVQLPQEEDIKYLSYTLTGDLPSTNGNN